MLVLQPKMFHLFLLFLFFFIAHFLLVENTYKNPYSLKAVNKKYLQKEKQKTIVPAGTQTHNLNLNLPSQLHSPLHHW
jgi:hypothetical protein